MRKGRMGRGGEGAGEKVRERGDKAKMEVELKEGEDTSIRAGEGGRGGRVSCGGGVFSRDHYRTLMYL